MKKIAVCDDEKEMLSAMETYLKPLGELFQIDFFQRGEELLASTAAYDVIFLDIDMKGISGIDTARRLRAHCKKTKIIYVTAYEDFRDYAFSVHAFGYLVKPVSREAIISVLREALDYAAEESHGPRLLLQCEEGVQEFFIKDIYYFEYKNRKSCVMSKKGEFHLREGIGSIGGRVADLGFAAPHKSFVVNLSHVKGISGYELKLSSGDAIPLSQKRSVQFRQIFARYLAQQI